MMRQPVSTAEPRVEPEAATEAFLLLLISFCPLERILPMHTEQTVFCQGWWSDLIYVVVNVKGRRGHHCERRGGR